MEPITVAAIASIVPACTLILGWLALRRKVDLDYARSVETRLNLALNELAGLREEAKRGRHHSAR